jgi:hypothetical protein
MTQQELEQKRQKLQTPRAAAVAGILFALLYSTSLIIIRLSIPAEVATDNTAWLELHSSRIILALNLIPYAGIAFLWFIGVLRDRLGELEDRLFATVFLGSGLMFLALNFVGAALAGALISSYALDPDAIIASGVFGYGRLAMYNIINVYAVRMAGVFMISLGTIWFRTGLMPRVWAIITYGLALVLLVSIAYSLWVTLIFPSWVFAVSLFFLIRNFLHREQP